MKKINRRSFLTVCAAVAGTAALTACGGSGDSAATAASSSKPTKMFDTASFRLSSGQMSWYFITSYQLVITGADTYQLVYSVNAFGADDQSARGSRHIIFSGKYTSAASSDGEKAHVDYSLEAPTSILLTQEGKMWTRSWGNCAFDTDNWTDTMTATYDVEGNSKKAADFLAEVGSAMTITVEDPSIDPEDSTLTYRILEAPELNLPQ